MPNRRRAALKRGERATSSAAPRPCGRVDASVGRLADGKVATLTTKRRCFRAASHSTSYDRGQ